MLETVPVTISALQINLKFIHLQTTILLFSRMLWLGIHRQSGHVFVSAPPCLKPHLGRLKGWKFKSSKGTFTYTSSSGLGRLIEQSYHLDQLPTILHEAWLPHICSLWVVRPSSVVELQGKVFYKHGESCMAFYDPALEVMWYHSSQLYWSKQSKVHQLQGSAFWWEYW